MTFGSAPSPARQTRRCGAGHEPGAQAYRGDMRPERLIPVSARLTNGVETGQGYVVATTRVGSPATVEVAITGPASTHVLRGRVIVAVPGSTSGAGDPAQMPPRPRYGQGTRSPKAFR